MSDNDATFEAGKTGPYLSEAGEAAVRSLRDEGLAMLRAKGEDGSSTYTADEIVARMQAGLNEIEAAEEAAQA